MFKFGGGKWQRTEFFFRNFLEGGENDKGGKMTEGITVINNWLLKMNIEVQIQFI